MEQEVCWICLQGPDEGDEAGLGPLGRPCKCPRYSHKACLTRWQIQNAGRLEEKQCRFCHSTLASWKEVIVENSPSHPAIMAVVFQGRTVKIPVSQGPEGIQEFKRTVCAMFNLPEGTQFDVSFECKSPVFGDKLRLKGFDCFDAASYCAAVSAARRASQRAARAAAAASAASAAAPPEPSTTPGAATSAVTGLQSDAVSVSGGGSSEAQGSDTASPADTQPQPAASPLPGTASTESSASPDDTSASSSLDTTSASGSEVFQHTAPISESPAPDVPAPATRSSSPTMVAVSSSLAATSVASSRAPSRASSFTESMRRGSSRSLNVVSRLAACAFPSSSSLDIASDDPDSVQCIRRSTAGARPGREERRRSGQIPSASRNILQRIRYSIRSGARVVANRSVQSVAAATPAVENPQTSSSVTLIADGNQSLAPGQQAHTGSHDVVSLQTNSSTPVATVAETSHHRSDLQQEPQQQHAAVKAGVHGILAHDAVNTSGSMLIPALLDPDEQHRPSDTSLRLVPSSSSMAGAVSSYSNAVSVECNLLATPSLSSSSHHDVGSLETGPQSLVRDDKDTLQAHHGVTRVVSSRVMGAAPPVLMHQSSAPSLISSQSTGMPQVMLACDRDVEGVEDAQRHKNHKTALSMSRVKSAASRVATFIGNVLH